MDQTTIQLSKDSDAQIIENEDQTTPRNKHQEHAIETPQKTVNLNSNNEERPALSFLSEQQLNLRRLNRLKSSIPLHTRFYTTNLKDINSFYSGRNSPIIDFNKFGDQSYRKPEQCKVEFRQTIRNRLTNSIIRNKTMKRNHSMQSVLSSSTVSTPRSNNKSKNMSVREQLKMNGVRLRSEDRDYKLNAKNSSKKGIDIDSVLINSNIKFNSEMRNLKRKFCEMSFLLQ